MVSVYIGIGSNIEPSANITQAMGLLDAVFSPVEFSRVFESEAVGFEGSNFLNLVGRFSTEQTIDQIVEQLKDIENEMGRVRGSKKFSDRRIDIDVLLFGDAQLTQPVELPRGEVLQNAYVLWPLSEIAPDLKHPGTTQTYQQLWSQFDQSSQNLSPVQI